MANNEWLASLIFVALHGCGRDSIFAYINMAQRTRRVYVGSICGNLHLFDFLVAHTDADGHWMATDFAVHDELGIALVRVEENVKTFAAMRTGDCYKFVHDVQYNGKSRWNSSMAEASVVSTRKKRGVYET
jgi:hypothetical protein